MRTFHNDYGAYDPEKVWIQKGPGTGPERPSNPMGIIYYRGNPPRYVIMEDTDEQIVNYVTSTLSTQVVWC